MLVSAISTPVTRTREEAVETVETAKANKDGEESEAEYLENLAQVLCIWYSIIFQKKSVPVSTFLDSSSKINIIYPTFAKELGLPIRPTDVTAQKIDGIMLDTYEMVVVAFSVTDKANRVRFFEETFLVANISSEIVFEMPFLTLSDADIDFSGWELRWKTYVTKEAFPITKHVELVDKKEFAAVVFDLESGTFIVHIISLSSIGLPSSSPFKFDIHLFCKSQISGLIVEEALTKVFTEYLDFANIFFPDLASKLPEHIGINDHAIKLVNS